MNQIIEFAPGIDKIVSGSLYPHQADGVAFLLSKKRAILADDMGLGKTRQAIVAMEAGAGRSAKYPAIAMFDRVGRHSAELHPLDIHDSKLL